MNVGDDLLVNSPQTPGDGEWARVVAIEYEFGYALVTPVYTAAYWQHFDRLNLDTAEQMYERGVSYSRSCAEEQEAEIRAEMAVPQHLVF